MSVTAPTPPTSGQRDMLSFFGLHATSKSEATQALNNCLEQPSNKRKWLCERARRCVATMRPAISGQGGHDATFAVACVLVWGFDLSINEAMSVLSEYNSRCDPPWTDNQLFHKLQTAESWPKHDKPRGHLIGEDFKQSVRSSKPQAEPTRPAPAKAAPKVQFDPEKLRTLAAKWRDVVTSVWLANRSAADPCTVTPEGFLKLLYKPGEKVWVGETDWGRGQAIWPDDRLPHGSEDGVKFLAQPVDGREHPNPRQGNMSRRSQEAVTSFRYIVLESDQADWSDWLGLLVQLPLRIEALYTSGSKSVHALIRVDMPTKTAWDDYKDRVLAPTINLLCLGGLDPKVLSAVRLTRLPNCWRGTKRQKLLYVRPNAPILPICEIPAERDVVATWLAMAGDGPADSDETGEGMRAVRRALDFYAPVSRACREKLIEYNKACEEAGFDCGK